MVEKSTKMASFANEELIYLFRTKSAIWRYNNYLFIYLFIY